MVIGAIADVQALVGTGLALADGIIGTVVVSRFAQKATVKETFASGTLLLITRTWTLSRPQDSLSRLLAAAFEIELQCMPMCSKVSCKW